METIITDVYTLYQHYFHFKENEDIFDGRIPMMERCVNGSDILILALEESKIVGFCLLEKKDDKTYSNEATSVDLLYRQRGVAKKMLFKAHEHIHSLGATIVSSGYSKDGLKYLKKIDEFIVSSYASKYQQGV